MTAILRLAGSAMLIVIFAGCSAASTASPIASPSAIDAPSAIPSTAASAAPSSGPTVPQTDTSWGRIWDGLPVGFPNYPGATPDEEATGGPSSGAFVVEGHTAQDVAGVLQTGLQKAGYTSVGSSQPLEDGSVVLDMTGSPKGCMLQVTVKPMGGVTSVTVLYGAVCPLG